MDIWLDSTETKRIDLCFDYKTTTGEVNARKFVARFDLKQRAFDKLIDAVEFYKSLEN